MSTDQTDDLSDILKRRVNNVDINGCKFNQIANLFSEIISLRLNNMTFPDTSLFLRSDKMVDLSLQRVNMISFPKEVANALVNLKTLCIWNNNFVSSNDLNIQEFPTLEYLSINHTKITKVFSCRSINLKSLSLNGEISSLRLDMPKLEEIYF